MKATEFSRLDQTPDKTSGETSSQSPVPQPPLREEELDAETNFGWYIAAIVIAVLIMASALYFKPVF